MSGASIDATGGETAPGPHVLHVIDRRTAARLGRMTRQTLLGLADAGVRISLLTDDAGVAHDCLPAAATPILLDSFDRWRFPPLPWRVSDAFDDDPPDMLHIWETRHALRLSAWARRIDAPVLVHAFTPEDVRFLTRISRHADRHVAAASARLCTALRERRPASHFPIQLFAPAILVPDDAPPLRRPGHVPGVLVMFEADDGSASVETLLRGLARIRDQGLAMQSVLIAPGPLESAARAGVREHKLDDRALVISDEAVWDSAMSGVDMQIIPARRGGADAAPLLAMAMRKLVLATSDQVCDWFVPDTTCWTYPPGDHATLASLLARGVSDAEAAASLGERARRFVAERHRVSALTAELARFYGTICYPRKTLRLAPHDSPSTVIKR